MESVVLYFRVTLPSRSYSSVNPPQLVQGELGQALGRIRTPDAIEALIKLSHPPTRLFKRTPPWVRVAAVEALAARMR
ncbi:MAG: HEAT repeat domain-containing protein [Tepidisphaeraceae bacterium]